MHFVYGTLSVILEESLQNPVNAACKILSNHMIKVLNNKKPHNMDSIKIQLEKILNEIRHADTSVALQENLTLNLTFHSVCPDHHLLRDSVIT